MPQRNREAYNAYQKKYQLKRYHERMATARLRLGGRCVGCLSTDDLEIDHIEWRQKKIKIGKLWSISKARFDEELEKCQLLCRDCHIDKSRTDISEYMTEYWENRRGGVA